MAYIIQNQKPSRPAPPIPNEKLTNYPWFISTCSNRTDATQILQSCPTIENGNFLVRRSENKNAKYTITIWFDNTITHVRINQSSNGQYQLEFQPDPIFQMPTFSTIKELIDFFSVNEMKLIGHCQDKKMTNTNGFDPYFDDEDEENEEVYRQLLKNHETLPPCSLTTIPVTSLSQRCTLCSRVEAENILKTNADVQPGNFIVRPSANSNQPYSLSILSNENSIYHFQIVQISNKYVIGPFDLTKSKTFSSVSDLLEHYLTFPIKLRENDNKEHSIYLKLYSTIESTQL